MFVKPKYSTKQKSQKKIKINFSQQNKLIMYIAIGLLFLGFVSIIIGIGCLVPSVGQLGVGSGTKNGFDQFPKLLIWNSTLPSSWQASNVVIFHWQLWHLGSIFFFILMPIFAGSGLIILTGLLLGKHHHSKLTLKQKQFHNKK